MTHRLLMVMRMDPGDADAVAEIFDEHDNTPLPVRLGASRRTLYRFNDLYIHLVESEDDILDRLYRARQDPIFARTNERLSSFLRPYSPTWRQMGDSRAEPFYDRVWPVPAHGSPA